MRVFVILLFNYFILDFYLILACVRIHGPPLACDCGTERAGDQGARGALFYYVAFLFIYSDFFVCFSVPTSVWRGSRSWARSHTRH